MEIKKITEGMTAPQVAGVIEENFINIIEDTEKKNRDLGVNISVEDGMSLKDYEVLINENRIKYTIDTSNLPSCFLLGFNGIHPTSNTFEIYKYGDSVGFSDIELIYNNVQFGKFVLIEKDIDKPFLYIFIGNEDVKIESVKYEIKINSLSINRVLDEFNSTFEGKDLKEVDFSTYNYRIQKLIEYVPEGLKTGELYSFKLKGKNNSVNSYNLYKSTADLSNINNVALNVKFGEKISLIFDEALPNLYILTDSSENVVNETVSYKAVFSSADVKKSLNMISKELYSNIYYEVLSYRATNKRIMWLIDHVPNANLYSLMINRQDGVVGQKFLIYKCKSKELEGLESLKYEFDFGKPYIIEKDVNKPFLYIFVPVASEYSIINVSAEFGEIKNNIANNTLSLVLQHLNKIDSKLYGKNIVCFGDSITEFKDSSGKGYCDYLSELTGANVFNGGIGGARLAQRYSLRENEIIDTVEKAYAALDVCNIVNSWVLNSWDKINEANDYLTINQGDNNSLSIENLKSINPSNADIVVIFAGTNDYTGNSTIGETNDESKETMYGALNNMIKNLVITNNKIQIFIFTPIVRWFNNVRTEDNWSDNYIRNDGKKLPDMEDIIKIAANNNHVNCCSWYWTFGCNKFNFSNFFPDNDGTHPTKSFQYMAKKIKKFIEKNFVE